MSTWACPDCGYRYDEASGDEHQGYAAGTAFAQLPEDFVCPDCYVRAKEDFVQQTV